VGFATQCSITPLRFIVFLSKNNYTYRVARGAPVLGVHVVPEGRLDLAALFGEMTGDDVDKLSQTSWARGPEETPILDACPAWFVGRIVDRFDAGDHVGFLLKPEHGEAARATAVGFQEVRHLQPGHPA
jgi:flavin reductase (DIM6/NTAB) family NADH-FMN oxidoreductase RutF